MRDFNGLRIFHDVVKAGGYAAASRQTGQSRATLSRRVSALEKSLGIRLIERSSRSFRLTEPGEQLYEKARDILAQTEDALASVENRQSEPVGLVRIAAPPSLLQLRIASDILDFMRENPKVRVQIEVTNRQIDIRQEGFDFVLRARTAMDYPLDYVPVTLARMDHMLVAHPKWQSKIRPTLAQTLAEIPAIAWNAIEGHSSWRLVNAVGEIIDIPLTPRLSADDISTLRLAALEGMGIALIPRTYVEQDVHDGRLIRVQTDLHPAPGIIHAVHLGQKGMRPAVRHLLDWLKHALKHLS